ncbi:MAG: Bug family tripartite tricarboxylate transporter substrate binding protein [Beijerinckiaceae bacterium]
MFKSIRVAGAVALGIGLAAPAFAQQSVADFYKGKTLTITVGHYTGTGFDIYSRALVRYMGKHIPGNPAMQVRNLTGASGVIAANWLYNQAPRDGTAMGIFVYTVPLEKLFGNKQAKFDPGKMIWIGNMEKASAFCGVNKQSGIKTFAELQNSPKEILFGGTGATGPLVTAVNAMKNLLGAKVKVVPGYKGMPGVKQAMAQDEVQGICGVYWSNLRTVWKGELERGEYVPILQFSGDRIKELPNVAHVNDFAKTEEQKQIFRLAFGVAEMARNYAMPPDVPPERVAAIRKAFMDTMKDPAFVEEAKKLQIELVPDSGEEVAKGWNAANGTPATIVEKAKKALYSR